MSNHYQRVRAALSGSPKTLAELREALGQVPGVLAALRRLQADGIASHHNGLWASAQRGEDCGATTRERLTEELTSRPGQPGASLARKLGVSKTRMEALKKQLGLLQGERGSRGIRLYLPSDLPVVSPQLQASVAELEAKLALAEERIQAACRNLRMAGSTGFSLEEAVSDAVHALGFRAGARGGGYRGVE